MNNSRRLSLIRVLSELNISKEDLSIICDPDFSNVLSSMYDKKINIHNLETIMRSKKHENIEIDEYWNEIDETINLMY